MSVSFTDHIGSRMGDVGPEAAKELRKAAQRVLQAKYGVSVSAERNGRTRTASYKKPDASIFGVRMKDVSNRPIQNQSCIPIHIKNIINHLESDGRLSQEGVYRRPGRYVAINALCDSLDCGILPDLNEVGVHDATGTVKKWLRELPDPVIPQGYQDAFMQACAHGAEALALLVIALPKNNRDALDFFIQHLQRVVVGQEMLVDEKRMGAYSLGLVFGQCLMKQSKTTDSKKYHTMRPAESAPSLLKGSKGKSDFVDGFEGQAKVVEQLITIGSDAFKIPEVITSGLQQQDPKTPSKRRRSGNLMNKVHRLRSSSQNTESPSTTSRDLLLSSSPNVVATPPQMVAHYAAVDGMAGDDANRRREKRVPASPMAVRKGGLPFSAKKNPSQMETAKEKRYKQQLVMENSRRKRVSESLEGSGAIEQLSKSSKRRAILAEMSARMASVPNQGDQVAPIPSTPARASVEKVDAAFLIEDAEDDDTENVIDQANRPAIRKPPVKRNSLSGHIASAGVKAAKRVVRRISGQLKQKRRPVSAVAMVAASVPASVEKPPPAASNQHKRRRSMQCAASSWQILLQDPDEEALEVTPEDDGTGDVASGLMAKASLAA